MRKCWNGMYWQVLLHYFQQLLFYLVTLLLLRFCLFCFRPFCLLLSDCVIWGLMARWHLYVLSQTYLLIFDIPTLCCEAFCFFFHYNSRIFLFLSFVSSETISANKRNDVFFIGFICLFVFIYCLFTLFINEFIFNLFGATSIMFAVFFSIQYMRKENPFQIDSKLKSLLWE